MKKLQKGDEIFIKAEIHGVFTEDGTVGPNDGFYTVILPEGLEYRFPESSMPMAIMHVKDLRQRKKVTFL